MKMVNNATYGEGGRLPSISVSCTSSVSFQRVAHGRGIGYAMIVDQEWIGTIHGADGATMWDLYMRAGVQDRAELLRGVVVGLLVADAGHVRSWYMAAMQSDGFSPGLAFGLAVTQKTTYFNLKVPKGVAPVLGP